MSEDKLIIHSESGEETIVNDPFSGMQSTYEALAADPNAMPELSDESRAEILDQLARERRKKMDALILSGEEKTKEEREEKERDRREGGRIMNRHERRKAAKLARKK